MAGTLNTKRGLLMRTRSFLTSQGLDNLKITSNIQLQLLDSLEDEVPPGGYIIDWHACDLFPRSWIDLVIVLRTNSTKLYDRLKARKYPEQKLQENLDSEIMEVLMEEAREAYDEEIVVELQSDEADDIEANVARIKEWMENWKKNNESHGEEKS